MQRLALFAAMLISLCICPPVSATISFSDITDSTVVGDTAHTYGSCLGDYDGDGDLDIFSGNIILTSNLYRNEGMMVFTNATGIAGFLGLVEAKGSSMADYDNDGDLDLALVGWDRDSFYKNNGDGTFTEFTDGSNFAVNDSLHGMSGVWADCDKDSYVDLFVSNLDGKSVLYRNQGNGTFLDVTVAAGIDCEDGTGALWFDYDDDGDADLFVCRYSGYPDQLYENDGFGSFTEVGLAAGVAGSDSSFGCVAGDIDGDGGLDLYVSKFNGAGTLYRNNRDGTFTDVTSSAGTAVPGSGTGCALEDFDSDGDLDLYVGCFWEENLMFENDGTGTFSDVTATAGVGDYGVERTGVGVCAGDLDRDGDVDIYCGNHKRNTLFMNDTESTLLSPSNKLVLRLTGTASNRCAIGAKVSVTTSGGTQIREVMAGSGVCSMSSLQLEFGLGSAADPLITVRWPNGLVESGVIHDVGYVDIVEGMFPGVAEEVDPRSAHRASLLYQNSPNPFQDRTAIRYELSEPGRVSIDLYGASGRKVCRLLDSEACAGVHTFVWDGTVDGVEVSEGIYIVILESRGGNDSRKIVLVK